MGCVDVGARHGEPPGPLLHGAGTLSPDWSSRSLRSTRLFAGFGTWHLVLVDTSINGLRVWELDDGPAVLELDADGAVG